MMEEREINLEHPTYPKYATVYSEKDADAKACILYFYKGELLYGSREDPPHRHMDTLTRAGYIIVSYDYPLVSAARLDTIMDDVCSSVTHYINHPEICRGYRLPFLPWGRSAGAYLYLLAGVKGNLPAVPTEILSYYRYGFLCDHWYETSNGSYCSLPAVSAFCLEQVGADLHTAENLDTHYSIYIYARQTGSRRSLLYEGRDRYFYLDYTPHACTALPCPLFCVHGTRDSDVPYGEFLELSNCFHPWQFIASRDGHDFDWDEKDPFTEKLLDEILTFLEENLRLSPAQY